MEFRLIVLIIFVAVGFVAPQIIFNAHSEASKAEENTGGEKWYLETPLAIRKAVVLPASVDKVWEVVLGRLQYRFQKGPIDWKKPFTPGAAK